MTGRRTINEKPVFRSVIVTGDDGRRATFDVSLTESGLAMRGPDDRQYLGVLPWGQLYLECGQRAQLQKPRRNGRV